MKTLGIETSCDETAVALYDSSSGIIAETVYSQIDLHKKYGGVVPELASRDHCEKIIDVFNDGIGEADLLDIDRIAYTAGPGLLGALIVGESFAQGLAFALNKPLIPVNHLEAHFLSPFLDFPEIQYPFTSLLVSGGHSLIVDVKDFEDYKIIGQSLDDAVGEAFDKVGKLLQLPYPGGPHIEESAKIREELSRRIRKDRISLVNFPEGCKDANDVLLKHGSLELVSCFDHAKPYPLEGVSKASDSRKEIHYLYNHGMAKGVVIGYNEFDKLMTWRPSEFTLVTGVPVSYTHLTLPTSDLV